MGIFLNLSASYVELRKLRMRLNLILNSIRKLGGVYIYANATSVDGKACIMFNGSLMILANRKVLK